MNQGVAPLQRMFIRPAPRATLGTATVLAAALLAGCGATLQVEHVKPTDSKIDTAAEGVYFALPRTDLQVSVPVAVKLSSGGQFGGLFACAEACATSPTAVAECTAQSPAPVAGVRIGRPVIVGVSRPDPEQIFRALAPRGAVPLTAGLLTFNHKLTLDGKGVVSGAEASVTDETLPFMASVVAAGLSLSTPTPGVGAAAAALAARALKGQAISESMAKDVETPQEAPSDPTLPLRLKAYGKGVGAEPRPICRDAVGAALDARAVNPNADPLMRDEQRVRAFLASVTAAAREAKVQPKLSCPQAQCAALVLRDLGWAAQEARASALAGPEPNEDAALFAQRRATDEARMLAFEGRLAALAATLQLEPVVTTLQATARYRAVPIHRPQPGSKVTVSWATSERSPDLVSAEAQGWRVEKSADFIRAEPQGWHIDWTEPPSPTMRAVADATIVERLARLTLEVMADATWPTSADPEGKEASTPSSRRGYPYRLPGMAGITLKDTADDGTATTLLRLDQEPIAQFGSIAYLPAKAWGRKASIDYTLTPQGALLTAGFGQTAQDAAALKTVADAQVERAKRRDAAALAAADAPVNAAKRAADLAQHQINIEKRRRCLAALELTAPGAPLPADCGN